MQARFINQIQNESILVNDQGLIKRGRTLYKERECIWQAPIDGTVYGTMFNYKEDLQKVRDEFQKEPYKALPRHPVLYMKPKNTYNSHLQAIFLPNKVPAIQINSALGIVIGKTAVNIREEAALNYIMGYTIVHDVTIPHDSFFRPAIKENARDGFCPIGPWIAPKNVIQDVQHLKISTYINNEKVLDKNTKNFVRSVPRLLTEVTAFMTLHQGDVLLAGVPLFGPKAKAGDIVRTEIEHIGTLENIVVEENGGASL